MKSFFLLFLIGATLSAASGPDLAKQLADSKREVARLNQAIAELHSQWTAWTTKAITVKDVQMNAGIQACMGNSPSLPAKETPEAVAEAARPREDPEKNTE